MSHTPGPWNICWGTYNGQRMNFHITADPHGSVHPIAETKWKSDWAEDERLKIEANAHLIAAAPDLLEAAESVVSWKDSIDLIAPELGGCLTAIYRLEAAISKAKGGQS